jgi:hypothetical protein
MVDVLLLQLRVFFSWMARRDNGLEALAVSSFLFFCVVVVLRFLLADLQHFVPLCRQQSY